MLYCHAFQGVHQLIWEMNILKMKILYMISQKLFKVKVTADIFFNVGGQTRIDCLLTWADGVKSLWSSKIEPATFRFESTALTTAPRDRTHK